LEKTLINLSIILPCYNEAKNIPLIVESFSKVIKGDMELILVNNGSSDDSLHVINELTKKYSFTKFVDIKINEGYGNGITLGLQSAKGEYLSYTHADMQTNPKDILKAYDIIKKQSNPQKAYIKGNRKKRAIFDQIFTIGMSIFETLYLKTILWDINAQPNMFHNSFFKSLDNIPKDFSLDLYFLYKAKKSCMNIIRFDVLFPPRIYGVSSWNDGFKSKLRFIKRTLDFTFKLKQEL
jgi:polyisoprenyl-phosphate glycosyltransferase